MKLKERIDELKDRSIHNVKKHFYEYILEDYYDAGFDSIDYLIEQDDWYHYWLNLRVDIRELRSEILGEVDFTKSIRDDNLLQLIEIQEVVDKELISNCESDNPYKQIMVDLGSLNSNETPPIKSNIKVSKLNAIFNCIHKLGLINCNKQEFTNHFKVHSNDKIVWYGSQIDLIYFFKILIDYKIIFVSGRVSKVVMAHFKIKNEEIKRGSFDSAWSEKSTESVDDYETLITLNRLFSEN